MKGIASYLRSFGVGRPKKIKSDRRMKILEWEEKMKEERKSDEFAERRERHKKIHGGYDPKDWIY